MQWLATYLRCWGVLILAAIVESLDTVDARMLGCIIVGMVVWWTEVCIIAGLRRAIARKTRVIFDYTNIEKLDIAVMSSNYVSAHMIIASMDLWSARFTLVCVLGACYMAYHHFLLDDLVRSAISRIRDQKASVSPQARSD